MRSSPTADAYRPLMDIGALEEVRLPDPDGERHRLGDLWAEKPVIVVFLRHFG